MSDHVYGDNPTGPAPTDPTPNPTKDGSNNSSFDNSHLNDIEDFYNGIYDQQYDVDSTNSRYESYLNDLQQLRDTENYVGAETTASKTGKTGPIKLNLQFFASNETSYGKSSGNATNLDKILQIMKKGVK